MTHKYKIFILILIFIYLVISSCTLTETRTNEAGLFITNTLVGSKTQTVSETPKPTWRKTNTVEPAISPTIQLSPSLINTMTNDEREKEALALLSTNGDCHYPCFWGFLPGSSRFHAMQRFMVERGFLWSGAFPYENNSNYYTGFDFQSSILSLRIGVSEIDDTVDAISVALTGYDIPSLASPFLVSSLMLDLGEPTEIWLYTAFAEGQTEANYTFWVYFESKGVILKYSGVGKIHSDLIEICPGDRYKFENRAENRYYEIKLYLQSADHQRALKELPVLFGEHIPDFSKKLEETTNIGMEEFYNMVADSSAENCFATPKTIWGPKK